jgi:hypothetical protein
LEAPHETEKLVELKGAAAIRVRLLDHLAHLRIRHLQAALFDHLLQLRCFNAAGMVLQRHSRVWIQM